MRMRLPLVTVATLAALAAGCASPIHVTVLRESMVALRGDIVPIAQLRAGTADAAPFLIDTGAETSLADDRWVATAQLPTDGYLISRTIRGIGWTREVEMYAEPALVHLGSSATASGVEMPIVDMWRLPVPGTPGAERAVAVLGADVLEHTVTLFDGPAGEVWFLPRDGLERRLAERYPRLAWTVTPVDWSDDVPVVWFSTPRGEMPLLLDTGAELSVVSVPWAAALGLVGEVPDPVIGDGGELVFPAPPQCVVEGVHLGERPMNFFAICVGTVRGILGNDVLRTFPFVLDGPGRRLLLPE